eukprot:3202197-Rhodomonas_salina.1
MLALRPPASLLLFVGRRYLRKAGNLSIRVVVRPNQSGGCGAGNTVISFDAFQQFTALTPRESTLPYLLRKRILGCHSSRAIKNTVDPRTRMR